MRLLLITLFCFSAYGLNYQIHPEATYSSTQIKSHGYDIKIHQWKKIDNEDIALTSHGYLDHCLYLKPVLNRLIDKGYNVVCYDLPGHGLSSGKKGDIKVFDEYRLVLNDVIKTLPRTKKKIFLGHSTGNVGLTQNLMDQTWSSPFDRIIMIAPLTRSYMWKAYQWAIKEPVVNKVKWVPIFMRNDHPDYKALVKNDPHRLKKIPTNWLWQLNKWYLDINETYIMRGRSLSVFFGKKDTIVDKKYGENFFTKVFPNSRIFILNESHHMPYYDKEENIKNFYTQLDSLL
jgi:alpha-beta hydrolase superfamily lysophospholipase